MKTLQMSVGTGQKIKFNNIVSYRLRTYKFIRLFGSTAIITVLGAHGALAANAKDQTLQKMQNEIAAQKLQLQQEEIQIEAESLKLDQAETLLNGEMKNLHGRGAAPAAAPQVSTPTGEVPTATQAADQTSIQGPTPSQQQTKAVLQTDSSLSSAGGVLTPKGKVVLDPSVEYDYYSQNQLEVNGFSVIPGITFGNINIMRVQEDIATIALTTRWGVTDRLELDLKLPVVANYDITTTQQVGPDAIPLTPSANNVNIGDIQMAASYQFNRDDTGWPIFIGNLLFKTATGVSPYSVPIYTVDDTNGQFLQGIPKRAGHGHWLLFT